MLELRSCRPRTGSIRSRGRKKVFLSISAALGLILVSFFFYEAARNTRDLIIVFGRDGLFTNHEISADNDTRKKAEILRTLNEDIDQSAKARAGRENRLFSRLDQLFRSLQAYLLPESGRPAPSLRTTPERAESGKDDTGAFLLRTAVDGEGPPDQERGGARPDSVLTAVPQARVSDLNLKQKGPKASLPFPSEGLSPLLEKPVSASSAGVVPASEVPPLWLRKIEPLEAWRAKGMMFRLHKVLALEGVVDASPVGETDPDLQDFGIRSVHAFALLQREAGFAPSSPAGRIESGYPRSFGIGLNVRLSPEVHFLFDYAHEFLNDSFIEYRGSWESSLVADYSRIRPEKNDSFHSFFFGLEYVYDRDPGQLVPVQAGFFYSTNMADDPLDSRVSVGFSFGGAVYQKERRFSMAYRLRFWDDPSAGILENHKDSLEQNISSQFLFSFHF